MRLGPAFGAAALFLVTAATGSPDAAAGPEDPKKPPAITTAEVPALPAALFARLAPYRNVRAASFAGWSPAGDEMLVATRLGETSQLHRVRAPGSRREQVTFYDEPAGGRWLPVTDRPLLLVTMSRGGNEDEQIVLRDLATGEDVLLSDGRSRHVLGPVRRDGSRIAFGANRDVPRDTDLYVMDPRVRGSERVVLRAEGKHWVSHDWSPDGARLLVTRHVSITESYPFVLDVASGATTPVPVPTTRMTAFDDLRFSPDGASAWLTTDAFGDVLELVRVELATGALERATRDLPWDVEALAVDRATGRVAFVTNEDGRSRLWILEGGTRRGVDLPVGVVRGLEFSPDGARLGFTLSKPDAPSDAWSVDPVALRASQWTFSETGGIPPARFVVPALARCRTFDDREVPLWTFRPRGASPERRAPVVLHLHGGPEAQYRPELSPAFQAYVAELGAAVVCPNVRGSAGQGRTWLGLDDGVLREDSVKDVGAVLDWIAAQPDLDASRVAVVGGSYGGYMVLASLVHHGARLAAGVDVVGIADFVTFLEGTAPYRCDLQRVEYGDERDPEMRAFLKRVSPLRRAGEIRAPLLVAHGANDPRVPLREAQQIAAAVRAAGRPAWTVFADNEGHGFQKRSNRDYLDAVTLAFLERHLLGRP